jgi:hydroxymethylbilane synthase
VKARVLSFGSLSSSLARNQTQAFIDLVHREIPKLGCQLTVLPSNQTDEDNEDQVFTAASSAEVQYLAHLITTNQVTAVVLEAADLPLSPPDGIDILCAPPRFTPFDAYLNRQGNIMDEMDPGSRVGVLSMRSKSQMKNLWPDIEFNIIHGGVDRAMETHMRHSEIDGLVLPAAATEHLGIQGIVAEIYAPEFILPGPGQGSLVVLGKANDEETRRDLAPLHCAATMVEITAEMAFRRHMISDQDLPVGVLARVTDNEVVIVGSTGACINRISVNGRLDQADEVGAGLAGEIMRSGEALTDLLEAEFPDGLPPEDEEFDLEGDESAESEDPDGPDLPEVQNEQEKMDAEIAALDEGDDFLDPDEYRA